MAVQFPSFGANSTGFQGGVSSEARRGGCIQ